jgi:hypothetical protein
MCEYLACNVYAPFGPKDDLTILATLRAARMCDCSTLQRVSGSNSATAHHDKKYCKQEHFCLAEHFVEKC